MSGPLGFHIWPPFTAFLHFLRPGTIKLAPFPNLPLFGGTTRTWLDVALYAAFVASLLRALRGAGDRRRRSSCRSSCCCRCAASATRRSCSPRASSITSR